ncbi:MAG: tRNA (adenosine(37)-N6)-threonylcarbamoyltransferase complex dimerization subunit type 1 TsaB [Verrucomicrobiae bacterium]|nr:tRNA (adenosine(37)-N6)-threonylcarbamoyltransferase complex dimerization subunit type 1 TsaB [Verrucomicrobiae bacterium]
MLLALENSSSLGSLCLIDGQKPDQILFQQEWKKDHRNEELFQALEKIQSMLQQVKVIVVGLGPGNFSGIRVGLAVARALRLSKGIQLMGIPSADAVGRQFAHVSRLGVFADAKRGEYYLTIYENGICIKKSHTISRERAEDEVSKLTFAVSAESLPEISERAWPHARELAQLGSQRWKDKSQQETDLEPIYLREAVKI